MNTLCKEKQEQSKNAFEESKLKIEKRVKLVSNELKPTEAELKILNSEIERDSKFNPISSSLAIIARAELSEGPRLQKPIDATV